MDTSNCKNLVEQALNTKPCDRTNFEKDLCDYANESLANFDSRVKDA